MEAVMGMLGRQDPDPQLVGGSPATISEAPYIASVTTTYPDGSTAGCTGSIISESWITTAGHCIYNSNKSAEISLCRTL